MPDGYEVVANYEINRKTLEITEVAGPIKVRPAVQWFAEQMERRLRENESRATRPRPTRLECEAAITANVASAVAWVSQGGQSLLFVEDACADVGNWLLLLLGKDVNAKAAPSVAKEAQRLGLRRNEDVVDVLTGKRVTND